MHSKPKKAVGPDRWVKQVRFDMQYAEKILIKDGSVDPVFIFHPFDPVAPLVVFGTGWENDEQKDVAKTMVQLLGVYHDAEAIVSIIEAWMAPPPEGVDLTPYLQGIRPPGALPPSESERRKEVVMVNLTYRDPETGGPLGIENVREIERRANGKPSGLVKFGSQEFHEPGPIGRFGRLMSPRRPTEEQRRAAKNLLDEVGYEAEYIPAAGHA